jgi:hypothetical protein
MMSMRPGHPPASCPPRQVTGNRACACAALSICLAAIAFAPAARGADLALGPDLSDCRSALRPGPSNCSAAPDFALGALLHADFRASANREPLEAKVDDFLANYGKPPREAVRALLDPTDDHIQAMLQQHENTLAVAAYVAERMTALQARGSGIEAGHAGRSYGLLPAFMQMRATLVAKPADPVAAEAMKAMRAVANESPSLQIELDLVGYVGMPDLRAELARTPASCTVRLLDPADIDAADLPYVRIDDLRERRSRTLDARIVSAQQLRLAIIALRESPANGALAFNPQDEESGLRVADR